MIPGLRLAVCGLEAVPGISGEETATYALSENSTSQVLEEQPLSIPSVCRSLPPTISVHQALRCKSLWGICVGDGGMRAELGASL